MLRVALTGGIATGKSYVLARLRQGGIPCVDADELVHGVMTAGNDVTEAIAARFGRGVIAADGSVDRSRLGPIVFADPMARRSLEAIVHPAVYRAITDGFRAFELKGGSAFAIVDVPLLFETGHAGDFDRIIATLCPATVQMERLRARGLTDADAQRRIAAQWPTEEKASRADFVVWTAGSFEETDRQVDRVIDALHAASNKAS
jgi:dephospho-CoA kinase